MAEKLQDFIVDSKAMVGKEAPDVPQGVRVADWPSIQRFCAAIGDTNSLYNDAAGGVGTLFHVMIAPPAYILSIRTPDSGAAYESKDYGVRKFSIKASAEWNDVIRMGERLVSELNVTAVRNGSKWGSINTAEVDSTSTYLTHYGGVLGSASGTVALVPYHFGDPLIVERDVYRYSDDEMDRMVRDLDATAPHRGKVPLYWSEVSEGDKLPVLVKGPVSYSELALWRIAEAKPATAHLGPVVHRELMEKPGRLTVNPSTHWPYFDVEQAYGDILAVQALGFKMPVSRGLLRFALAAQVVTNWMGDLGFLRRLSLDLPNHFLYGDTMWLTGEVTKMHKEEVGTVGYNAVEIRISGTSQLGDTLVEGTAVAYLPEKGFLVGLPIGNPWL